MAFNLDDILRENIKKLTPYSSARDEFKGEASVFLDANENSLGSPLTHWYNRYPDPMQWAVKEKLAAIKGVPPDQLFIGNGSDECIDLLIRACCEPGVDNLMICPPTYGMYQVSADINNVAVKKVPLTTAFQLDLPGIEAAIDGHTKIIFICSPNNPSGNSIDVEDIGVILQNYFGLVVIDEAYINFSRQPSFIRLLQECPNLVVMQTLSKAWGLAALRLGIAFSSTAIIDVMNRIKPPYNINQASQELALQALDRVEEVNDMIRILVEERGKLEVRLNKLSVVEKVYPSDANFLLVKVKDATKLYQEMLQKGIVLRNRSNIIRCEDCLRITVGTETENNTLIEQLRNFSL